MNILSIQSAVALGHVGNSAAVFPMQRLGHEVWPVNTVNFSNHTEYPTWRGPMLAASEIDAVITGIAERGVFPLVDACLSGYLGSPDTAEVIVNAAKQVKEANPDAVYVCDPVIGNKERGSFVLSEIPDLLRDTVIPAADYIIPNQWELGLLVGRELSSISETIDAARALHPRTIVTSCEAGEGRIGMLAVYPDEVWYVETPRMGGKTVGTGDLAAALFTALHRQGPKVALEHMAGTLYGMVEATVAGGLPEMPLIEKQELIVAPPIRFVAQRVD
ncbi:pyridoxal kinase PdxY [Corynebacterium sp. S7]